ncbi:AAA family ATPase [Bacillus paranthracis]|uniref:AAA family ATPase n=1 Tax=Bacillus cereus group TaxID=86661 RepID=UPI0021D23FD9|nr:AAA family ATPase [Bacillus paranthracis]MCU4949994.1 hypothetical protein [Bacillus paranthracis]MDR4139504.1 hypothetical protein [Bacillus paranthracis]MDR4393289.1 hypothetical protein [Bacillus paranthracis]MED1073457.1 hypothetical protein [Bacillus paranthracis]HDR4699676.1 hypothetical protein [Bacillus paranthracis]
MYLKSVKLKNFRGYGENPDREDGLYVFDDLDKDFVVFHGFNGFGKSSFFEAIEWCLTDTIKRIENFHGTYSANELKTSQHLKHFHPTKGNIEDRKVVVELLFNNGLKMVRTTKSIAYRFGNGNNYASELIVEKNGEKIKDYMHEFTIEEKIDRNNFIHAHLLGQENINHFIRAYSPEQRRSIFMQMLDLHKLNSLYTEAHEIKRSRGFVNKKDEIERNKSSLEKNLKGIDTFLRNKNYETMDKFLSTVQAVYQEIVNIPRERVENGELASIQFKPISKISPKVAINILEENEKKYYDLLKIKRDLYDSKQNLEKIKRVIEDLELYKVGERLYKENNISNFLMDTDLHQSKKRFESAIKSINILSSEINNQISKRKNLTGYESAFSNLIIMSRKEILQEEFWNEITKVKKRLQELGLILMFNNTSNEKRSFQNLIGLLGKDYWKQKQLEYNKLINVLDIQRQRILSINENIKTTSKLNKQYQELLLNAKNYILENDTNIKECPICLSNNFDQSEIVNNIEGFSHQVTIVEKLKTIIDYTSSSGEEIINNLIAERADEEKKQAELKQSITNLHKEIAKVSSELSEEYNKQYNNILIELDNRINFKKNELLREKQEKDSAYKDVNRINQAYKLMFGEELTIENYEKQNMIKKREQTEVLKQNWYHENKEKLRLFVEPSYNDIKDKILELETDEDVSQFYPNNRETLDLSLNLNTKDLETISLTEKALLKLLEFKIPEDFKEKFTEYEQLNILIRKDEQKLELLEYYKGEITKIVEELSDFQKSTVEEKLKKHPIISWIYEIINPHPFYNKLVITNENRGTNFKDESENLILDQIFSSAQLNILALSVFLGLGLSQEKSKLEQLFMDDPIQSMDDINTLAFIDVLRGIMDSQFKKKLIISTHDEKFAKLLAIKMRNREFTQYKFISYSEEGPMYIKL